MDGDGSIEVQDDELILDAVETPFEGRFSLQRGIQ